MASPNSLAKPERLSYCPRTKSAGGDRAMLAALSRALVFVLGSALALASATAQAQQLDKVTFATNWVAEAEHGGFYQALVDGTYRKAGLDVTILPGGPNATHRLQLLAGKIEFYMSANSLHAFDAVAQNVPTLVIASIFQKDPQVLLAHPDQRIEQVDDLKKLTLFVSKEG